MVFFSYFLLRWKQGWKERFLFNLLIDFLDKIIYISSISHIGILNEIFIKIYGYSSFFFEIFFSEHKFLSANRNDIVSSIINVTHVSSIINWKTLKAL